MSALWWHLQRRAGLLLWTIAMAWHTFGFRAVAMPSTSMVGVLDDVSVWLAGCWACACLDGWRRIFRLGAMVGLGLVLGTFNFCNALFLAFFDSLLNIDAYRLLQQAGGARTSIMELITSRVVWTLVVVPLVLMGLAVWASMHPRARRPWRHAHVLGVAALLVGGAHAVLRHEAFLMAEHNGVMYVARQAVERFYLLHLQDPAARKREILASLERTYPLPPETSYRHGVDPEHPLVREPVHPTQSPERPFNVVLVLMESVRLSELDLDGEKPLAPNLARLAREGHHFTNFYANGYQTVRGEMATLCGILPNFGGGQVYSSFANLSTRCLPQILADHGYQTHWISSFTADYGNKRGFLKKHGIQHFHDKAHLKGRKLKKPEVGWGASDEDLADFAIEVLDRVGEPFFAEVMTLSNHHPFNNKYGIPPPPQAVNSPERTLYKDYLRGLNYTDHAVGYFIEMARSRPWFKNTVFVILGDHGIWLFPEKGPRSLTPAERIEVYHRTPLILWSPGNLPSRRDPTVGSQVDVAPTLLELLGIRAANAFQGVSLLQPLPPDGRTVVMGNDAAWSIRQGNRYCYALGQSCFVDIEPKCPKGYRPKSAGWSCFEASGDLLDGARGPAALQMLSERDGATLTERGRRMVENNAYLLLHDGFFPRDGASTAAR